ncbi:MAG: CPBP family intramembrane glutamic endopeptidase [Caldilineaceae bacterium]
MPLYLILWVVIQILSSLIIKSPLTTALAMAAPVLTPIVGNLLFYSLNLVLVLLMTWWMARVIDHRALVDLGLQIDRHWWLDLCFGLLLGALLMTLIFGVEWLLGWAAVIGYFHVGVANARFLVMIWQPILLFVVVGINEELLARGYQLRNLAEGLQIAAISPRGAVILAWLFSSTLFGLLHILNPNSTWVSTVALMLAGVFLGLGYVLTGRLGLSIGLHMTWNFFQGSVYGFPVSGNELSTISFIAIHQTGPPLWTGGAFGPEAGLMGISAIFIGSVLTLAWVQWRYGQLTIQTELAHYSGRNGHIRSK